MSGKLPKPHQKLDQEILAKRIEQSAVNQTDSSINEQHKICIQTSGGPYNACYETKKEIKIKNMVY